ncbi:hypothetical protein AB0C86_38550 [Streptomyces lavendulae]|uniref:hypothetical protein n=1 Tax=Streptomyces lavendulae TaxID=1914 RepID=UPI003401758E
MWTGAAFGSGRWFSLPAHVPLCAFAMTALGAAVARLRPRWPLPAVLAAGAVALALPPLVLALGRAGPVPRPPVDHLRPALALSGRSAPGRALG